MLRFGTGSTAHSVSGSMMNASLARCPVRGVSRTMLRWLILPGVDGQGQGNERMRMAGKNAQTEGRLRARLAVGAAERHRSAPATPEARGRAWCLLIHASNLPGWAPIPLVLLPSV
jgi:hypothetical protein